MMLHKVIELLKQSGFQKKEYSSYKIIYNQETQEYEKEKISVLNFENVYVNITETELYILIEKEDVFTHQDIKSYEKKVFDFTIYLGNNPLRYNINLILLCPLELQNKSKRNVKEINEIINYERDKYHCRKIFIDVSNVDFEDELLILPSFPLKVSFSETMKGYDGVIQAIHEILPDHLYNELKQKENKPDIEKILSIISQ
ncbi:hypothetical protein PDQ31_14410 [Bacillus cereus]|uniref:hypothetical protein n=1 Tax=Bacillus cereus TaxID=1396 RepID=UPI000279B71A|nr:hypothetical protein [Bacillus cereus]EJR78560.1 hypothetical protein IK9_03863 [Bacillus cereus VD166]MDA2653517.1 hypothetical protein [Bacillus cereus]